MIENARRSRSACRTSRTPQSCGTPSHLCASNDSESARSRPRKRPRVSGRPAASRPHRAVAMKPDAVTRADVGERVERVDRADVHRSELRDDAEGQIAAAAVVGEHAVERGGIDGEVRAGSARGAPRSRPRFSMSATRVTETWPSWSDM